jgi:hypothetical protein
MFLTHSQKPLRWALMSTIDFSKDHRIRFHDGFVVPLFGFTAHAGKRPSGIPFAGISPQAEAAMTAASASGPPSYDSDTATFTCDMTLTLGSTYDYLPPGANAAKPMKIVEANGREYRGQL